MTGAGRTSEAVRTHAQHEAYARQTLYVYMPCDELRGLDYVDDVCERQFGKSWTAFLRAFVAAETNKWCPPWIRHNYNFANRRAEEPEEDEEEEAPPDDAAPKPEDDARVGTERSRTARKPRTKFVFEEDGEPPVDEAEEAGCDDAGRLDLEEPPAVAAAQRARPEPEPYRPSGE